jgi:hypothetical protein
LRITPTTDWDQWEHLRCGAASIQDQEFIADQKTVPADLIGFVAERPPNTSRKSRQSAAAVASFNASALIAMPPYSLPAVQLRSSL